MRQLPAHFLSNSLVAGAALVAAGMVVSAAFAQPITAPVEEVTTVATGMLTLEIDGVSHEYQLSATYYPADYGSDEEEGAVGDMMRRLAGRSLHEATWSEQVMEMAGRQFVLSENLKVEVSASTTSAEVNDLGRFSLVLPLHPETLVLDPTERAVITYWPPQETGFAAVEYFEASSDGGNLTVEVVEAAWANEHGFSLRGSFTGTMVASPTAKVVEGQTPVTGTFEVSWVDGGGTEVDVPLETMMDEAD